MSVPKDYTDKTYGELTALYSLGYTNRGGSMYWQMRCSCGEEVPRIPAKLVFKPNATCGHAWMGSSKFVPKESYRSLYRLNIIHQHRIGDFAGEPISIEEYAEMAQQDCYYCGAPPANENINNRLPTHYQGIDRTDNCVGYITGNCVPCCWECNSLKSNRNKQPFVDRIQRIYRHLRSEGLIYDDAY